MIKVLLTLSLVYLLEALVHHMKISICISCLFMFKKNVVATNLNVKVISTLTTPSKGFPYLFYARPVICA